MGVAGQRAEDRGLAHYRWAERYAKRGKLDKELAHFGRALDFGGKVLGGQQKDQITEGERSYKQKLDRELENKKRS
jgi:hypothetical protein